jgi:hypothetical protein
VLKKRKAVRFFSVKILVGMRGPVCSYAPHISHS